MSIPSKSTSRLLDRLASIKAQQAVARSERISRLTQAHNARMRDEGFKLNWMGPWFSCAAPKMHTDWVIANPDAAWPKMNKVIELAEAIESGRLVAMLGNRGTGKTQLAVWIARNRDGESAYFRAADLMSLMKSWYAYSSEWRRNNEWMLANVPLLIIDEMQERCETEHEDRLITNLIDKRYGNMLPTILIANLTPAAFSGHVGASVASRITEGGVVLVCDWPSFRTADKRSPEATA